MKKRKRRTNGKQNRDFNPLILVGIVILTAVAIVLLARQLIPGAKAEASAQEVSEEAMWEGAPDLDVQLLTVNDYSRPGIALNQVNDIVIHYTANPGSSAQANRDYFEGLKDSHTTKVSSHFIVGLEGEVIQCIPTAEISYASNDRNSDTVSIECCHPDETGQFNDATYNSVVQLTAWLCKRFDLTSEHVIRHYDITGKDCPKYFVENPDAWDTFRADVENRLNEL